MPDGMSSPRGHSLRIQPTCECALVHEDEELTKYHVEKLELFCDFYLFIYFFTFCVQ